MPEEYILYNGPSDPESLQRALRSWSWAAGPVGEMFPLVLVGLTNEAEGLVNSLAAELKIDQSVSVPANIQPSMLAGLYRQATAIFHPADAPVWAGALRLALGFGKAYVGIDTGTVAAMAGPAAILVEERDTRRLGASLIGVVVKEELRRQLETAAVERSRSWNRAGFGRALYEIYLKFRK